MKDILTAYIVDRDKAVRSLDVKKFRKFCKKWKTPYIPTDEVLEITMRKMLYNLYSATDEERNNAKEWLESRGYSTSLKED